MTIISSEEGDVCAYRALYEQLPSNWSAYSPDLLAILVTGAMREAIPVANPFSGH